MKKEDFKSGMILTFDKKNDSNDDKYGLVISNEIFLYRKNKWDGSLSLSHIHWDKMELTNKYKIMKVQMPVTPTRTNIGTSLNSFLHMEGYKQTVWERPVIPEETVMTIGELEQKYGITNLKIKGEEK